MADGVASQIVEIEGHIIDSLTLTKVLALIVDAGADYHLLGVTIGRSATDESRARIEVTADREDVVASLLVAPQAHGVERVQSAGDAARVVVGELEDVLPPVSTLAMELPWGRPCLMCPPERF